MAAGSGARQVMSRTRASGTPEPTKAQPAPGTYRMVSKQPLQILVFLLPLVILYELGLAMLLRTEGGVQTVTAHKTIIDLFVTFGVTPTGGLLVGGMAIVIVLLIWHLLNPETGCKDVCKGIRGRTHCIVCH